MRLHVGTEDGVDAGLIAALAAQPAQQVGIERHGNRFFWRGQHHLGRFPECGVRGVRVGSAASPFRIAPGVRRRRPDQSVVRLAFAVARFALFAVWNPSSDEGACVRRSPENLLILTHQCPASKITKAGATSSWCYTRQQRQVGHGIANVLWEHLPRPCKRRKDQRVAIPVIPSGVLHSWLRF